MHSLYGPPTQTAKCHVTACRYRPPQLSAAAVSGGGLLNTDGSSSVVLTGTNLGPAAVTASYGAYGPVSCLFASPGALHRSLTCGTLPGMGVGLQWVVTVGGQQSAPSGGVAAAYAPPVVLSLSPASGYATGGGENVTLAGTNFGPLVAGNAVGVTYGPPGAESRHAPTCWLVAAHTRIVCRSAPGVGAGLRAVVSAALQTGAPSAPTLSYAAPLVAVPVVQWATAGQAVQVTGANFGPAAAWNPVSALFGPYAAPCAVLAASTVLSCDVPAGVGSGYTLVVTVGGQSSNGVSPVGYLAPAITGVSGTAPWATSGGDTVVLVGSNFGAMGSGQAVRARIPVRARALTLPRRCGMTPRRSRLCPRALSPRITRSWSA